MPIPPSYDGSWHIASACISAIMRLYSAFNSSSSEDKTYWFSQVGLWNLSEIASGILAVNLPVSLKFFRSLKESGHWSNLRRSLQSRFKKYSHVDSERGASNAYSIEMPSNYIIRTTDIVTTHQLQSLPLAHSRVEGLQYKG